MQKMRTLKQFDSGIGRTVIIKNKQTMVAGPNGLDRLWIANGQYFQKTFRSLLSCRTLEGFQNLDHAVSNYYGSDHYGYTGTLPALVLPVLIPLGVWRGQT
jgi:hypothetical protein